MPNHLESLVYALMITKMYRLSLLGVPLTAFCSRKNKRSGLEIYHFKVMSLQYSFTHIECICLIQNSFLSSSSYFIYWLGIFFGLLDYF